MGINVWNKIIFVTLDIQYFHWLIGDLSLFNYCGTVLVQIVQGSVFGVLFMSIDINKFHKLYT